MLVKELAPMKGLSKKKYAWITDPEQMGNAET